MAKQVVSSPIAPIRHQAEEELQEEQQQAQGGSGEEDDRHSIGEMVDDFS